MITKREMALWLLLDDIDTAFDAYRPQMEAFENYVQKMVGERHQYLHSNGYELFEGPPPSPIAPIAPPNATNAIPPAAQT